MSSKMKSFPCSYRERISATWRGQRDSTEQMLMTSSIRTLIDEHGFTAEKIYNVDETETGHSTVQKASKVISTKGKRHVGATTSAERGTNTTAIYCHSAMGHFLPPVLVFGRERMADGLKVDAPTGTVFACTDSGWIDSDVFTQWMKHFIQSINQIWPPSNWHGKMACPAFVSASYQTSNAATRCQFLQIFEELI